MNKTIKAIRTILIDITVHGIVIANIIGLYQPYSKRLLYLISFIIAIAFIGCFELEKDNDEALNKIRKKRHGRTRIARIYHITTDITLILLLALNGNLIISSMAIIILTTLKVKDNE